MQPSSVAFGRVISGWSRKRDGTRPFGQPASWMSMAVFVVIGWALRLVNAYCGVGSGGTWLGFALCLVLAGVGVSWRWWGAGFLVGRRLGCRAWEARLGGRG